MKRRIVPVLGLLVVVLLCSSPAAQADVGQKIIRLCAQGKSLAGFPPGDYAKALKEISATTEEYSECGQLIRAAQQAAASEKGGGSSSGSTGALPTAVTATPAEQASIAGAAKSGSAPVSLDGQVIHPGVVHANIASAFSKLPTPLLVLLGFVLACLLALAARPLRDRIRGRGAD
ncbi:MAG TPA: hypothetical protein VH061_04605 [Solirubrobacteraceae bacterium]|nr:hypothetical protein [Solirubrobacteraceae bacterium]